MGFKEMLLRIEMVIQVLSWGLILAGVLPKVFRACSITWAGGLDNVLRSSSVLEHWYPSKYLSFPMAYKCQFKIHYFISTFLFIFIFYCSHLIMCVHMLARAGWSHAYNSCTELRLQQLGIQCGLQIKLIHKARHNTKISKYTSF